MFCQLCICHVCHSIHIGISIQINGVIFMDVIINCIIGYLIFWWYTPLIVLSEKSVVSLLNQCLQFNWLFEFCQLLVVFFIYAYLYRQLCSKCVALHFDINYPQAGRFHWFSCKLCLCTCMSRRNISYLLMLLGYRCDIAQGWYMD